MKKKLLSIVLMLVMVIAMAMPVSAEGTGTEWGPEDFTYGTVTTQLNFTKGGQLSVESHVITGFSDAGTAKLETNKNLVIPTTDTEGKAVEGIGKNAFKGNTSIESVVFPATELVDYEGPKSGLAADLAKRGNFIVGYGAFQNCTALSNVTFGEGLLCIDTYAFSKCPIKTLVFPKTLGFIHSGAFNNSKSVEKVTFAKQHDFNLCIAMSAFGSNKLKAVKLPEGTDTIGKAVFQKNTGMDVEPGIVYMYVSETTMNQTGTSFFHAGNDKSSSGQKFVVGNAYEWTADSFTYDGATVTGLSTLGLGVLMDDTDVVIPEKTPDGTAVTAIGEDALKGLGLTSVSLPEGLETIAKNALAGNELTTVALPTTIKAVDAEAFAENEAAVELTVTTEESYNLLKDTVFSGATLVDKTPAPEVPEVPEEPTPEEPTPEEPTPEEPTPEDTTPSEPSEDEDTPEDDVEIEPVIKDETPKTGDAAPVATLSVVMFAALVGIVSAILKKRSL